ncbi:MAG: acetoacetyl-CoA synthase [Marmoricola sp.]|nr:acetoacetyl-CoA synthase [Marmoricola sp.]
MDTASGKAHTATHPCFPLAQDVQGGFDWAPGVDRVSEATLTGFASWVSDRFSLPAVGYDALWKWSTDELSEFWSAIWDYFEIVPERPPGVLPLGSEQMPGAVWFKGARLNYAENVFRHPGHWTALICRDESDAEVSLTYDDLRREVARVAGGMRILGVGRATRVAAILPNRLEAVVAFLATASLGATWALCPPEFGTKSIVDRFAQIEPKVLIGSSGHTYAGKSFDSSGKLSAVAAGLPTLASTVVVGAAGQVSAPTGVVGWDDLTADGPLAFEPTEFSDPLWVLYSSGTTGIPKAMVHSHGGIVLEEVKAIGLHLDLKPQDRLFWYTSTGWMMWNYVISGLLVGATTVLYDGSPDPTRLWAMAEELGVTVFGGSPGFFEATRRSEVVPRRFESLRTIGSTGAPLGRETHRWLLDTFGSGVHVASVSGGTDVCSGFLGPVPTLPARVGEIQRRMLGVACAAFDTNGRPVIDAVGDLVVTRPMPSMPVGFWGDEDGGQYARSYFTDYPGVWRHGDWVTFSEDGAAVVSGRSDSTLNRGGVRMGTSEFYRGLAEVPAVADALVIDTLTGDRHGELILFVVLLAGHTLDAEMTEHISATLRRNLSPRHVPDVILGVDDIPYTLTGKKCEVPVKRILTGTPLLLAVDPSALRNPVALEAVIAAHKRHSEHASTSNEVVTQRES